MWEMCSGATYSASAAGRSLSAAPIRIQEIDEKPLYQLDFLIVSLKQIGDMIGQNISLFSTFGGFDNE